MQAPGFSASGKELLILAGLAVGLYLFTKHEVKTAAKAVGEAVNPLSQNNVINKGVNAVTQAITMEKDVTLGTKIYDWFNPGAGNSITAPSIRVVPTVSTKK